MLPVETQVEERTVLAVAALALACGFVLLRYGMWISDPMWHLALAGATVVLSVMVHFTHQITLYALLYMWPALYAFFFFSWAAAIAHLAFIGAAYAMVLSLQEETMGSIGPPADRARDAARRRPHHHAAARQPARGPGAQRAPGEGAALERAAHAAHRRQRPRRLHLDGLCRARDRSQRRRRAAARTLAHGRDRAHVPGSRRAADVHEKFDERRRSLLESAP